jgi:hypothetical protein
MLVNVACAVGAMVVVYAVLHQVLGAGDPTRRVQDLNGNTEYVVNDTAIPVAYAALLVGFAVALWFGVRALRHKQSYGARIVGRLGR